MSDAIRYFFKSTKTSQSSPRQDSEMDCFDQVEVVHNFTHFVGKSYRFQNTKAQDWDLAQTTTVRNVLFGIPKPDQAMSLVKSSHQFTHVQGGLVSRCRAKSSDIWLHWHIARLFSVYSTATGFVVMHNTRD